MPYVKQVEQLVRDILKHQGLAMLGSVDPEGYPAIRAMLKPRRFDSLEDIWFTTHSPSAKVHHYTRNPRACVYVYDPENLRGVLLTGTIRVYDARSAEKELGIPGDSLYAPPPEERNGYVALRFCAAGGRLYSLRRSNDFTVR